MEGRLQGKRLTATHFLDEVLEHGAEGCNYLLAVDVDMETVDGYAMASWERGYGDFEMKPDLDDPAAGPVARGDGAGARRPPVGGRQRASSPRRGRSSAASSPGSPSAGWTANAGTELEFIVFNDTYEEAWQKAYRDLEPANLYNIDYSLLGTARVEPLIRRIRNEMAAAGLTVENSKGECNLGQHEINFRYGEALAAADEHASTRTAPRRSPPRRRWRSPSWRSSTSAEGNSCHIHCSLARRGRLERVRRRPDDVRALPRRPARLHARADADVRAARQLLQALRRGLVRADRGRLGQRQPHLLDARRRPRRVAALREPAARRRRQPLPGARAR